MIRKAWEWATASAGRFLGLIILFAVVVIVVSQAVGPFVGGVTDARDRTPPQGTPSATATAEPTPSTSQREAATEGARRYLVAFFRPGGSTAQWHVDIDRYSTPGLAALNADTPRSEIPTTHLASLRVTGMTDDYAEIRARMSDGMVLFVAVVRDGDEWLVNEFQPEHDEGAAA